MAERAFFLLQRAKPQEIHQTLALNTFVLFWFTFNCGIYPLEWWLQLATAV